MLSSIDTDDSKCEQSNVHASTTATKKCVDFVSDLPWEIVKSHLVPRIFSEGRPIVRLNRPHPYLDVSHTWTKRLVSADDSIQFILSVDHSLSEHHRMRLRMVAPCIKSLSLPDLGACNIPELLKCGQFLSLTKLNIEVTCSQEALLQLLDITPNLTHLDMTFYDDPQAPFALFDVLDRCPQLIRLELLLYPDATIDMTPTTTSQRDRVYGNITHLQAICKNEERRDVFVPLIQHLPNLRVLSLVYPPSSTGMNTIHQHCPNLQQLFLSDDHVPFEFHDDIKEEDGPGLKLLSIDGGFYFGDYIPETMIRHHATLESLVMKNGFYLSMSRVDTFLDRQNVEFNQLKSLTFPDISQHNFIRFMEWVIQHAPSLQSIETMNLTGYGHTLRQRPLKQIGFRCSTPQPQQEEYQFLQHHVQLGAESYLQEIKCILHSISERDSWIFLIPKLTQLKTLELCFARNDLSMELKTFLQKVSEGCMALEKVIVKSVVFPISSEWIRHLSNHRNLQEMVIDTTHIPDHLMIELEGFSHLKRLDLKYHIKDWHSLTQLKHRIPNLVYTNKPSPI